MHNVEALVGIAWQKNNVLRKKPSFTLGHPEFGHVLSKLRLAMPPVRPSQRSTRSTSAGGGHQSIRPLEQPDAGGLPAGVPKMVAQPPPKWPANLVWARNIGLPVGKGEPRVSRGEVQMVEREAEGSWLSKHRLFHCSYMYLQY